MITKSSHYYEKRRNTPRLPIVYTTPEILQKLNFLAEKYGSKKAAIEMAICALYDKEVTKDNHCPVDLCNHIPAAKKMVRG